MGISAADQERLFERFYRTTSATEQAIPGIGLGLSISQAIAEAHGGKISVSSLLGVGTTFRFEAPLRRADTELRASPHALAAA
jgi:signal transduction histidine kinase